MVGERAHRRVLSHRKLTRPQCGIASAPQRLLHALHQIADGPFGFRCTHERNLTNGETMTTIRRDNTYATLINVFTVEPDNAAELTSLLAAATENVMRH